MKVLMISKACIVGAYQKKLEEMATIAGVDLTVVVPPYWDDPNGLTRLEQTHTQGYRLLVSNMVLNGHYHLHFYPKLKKIAREIRPDIIHIDEEPYNLATFHAMRIARSVGAGTVVFSWQNLGRLYPPPFNFMESYVLRHAGALLVGNSEAGEVWHKKGYNGPIYLIPQFGVDPAVYYRHPRPVRKERRSVVRYRKAQLPSQPALVMGYVGRLVEEKGLEVLFLAASKLVGPWNIQILGDGPDRPRLEQMVQWLGLSGRVTFDQWMPSTHLPHYFSGLDVLVLPSLSRANWKEQFGRVLIEAMACDVITIGARCGAIPEVIGEAGLTFAEGDVDELRGQLQNLIDNVALRQELRSKGRQRVVDNYTQAAVAKNTVNVYRRILGEPVEDVEISEEESLMA
jgi:glycosyltransferase involved in cell wall biosynthesis